MEILSAIPIQECMNHLNLRISNSASVRTDASWHEEKVCSPYSRLYFVTGGSGELRYGSTRVQMQPGRLYLIPPGLTFDYCSPVELQKLYFHVNILKPDGYEMLQDIGRILECPYPVERTEQLKTYFFGNNCLDAFLLESEVRQAIAELLVRSGFRAPPIKQYSEPIVRAIRYIQRHLTLQLTAASIAEELFLSESQLTRRFRTEVGCTVSQYVDDLLFFSAQMQLASDDRSIGEISEALGFCDQFYFSRRFRQRYGVTPRQYRARLLTELRGR